MRAALPSITQTWVPLSSGMATPDVLCGDRVRTADGATGLVVRRHWFGRATVQWHSGGFSTVAVRDLTRSDAR